MAGFAIRTSFAGHASNSARADNALTFKLDHHMGGRPKGLLELTFWVAPA